MQESVNKQTLGNFLFWIVKYKNRKYRSFQTNLENREYGINTMTWTSWSFPIHLKDILSLENGMDFAMNGPWDTVVGIHMIDLA